MTFRYDPCHNGLSPSCKHTFTRPYLSRLGSGPLPDLSMAASTLVALRLSAATTRHIHAALRTNDTLIGDLRCALGVLHLCMHSVLSAVCR